MSLNGFAGRESTLLLERYRLERFLASSLGVACFDAIEIESERQLSVELAHSDEGCEDAQVDPKLQSAKHPHLVVVERAGVTGDGISYAIMPRVRGELLAAVLARAKRMLAFEAVENAIAIAEILDSIHAQGAVHGSLHPLRVFVGRGNREGDVWLTPGLQRGSQMDLASDEWIRNLEAERPSVPWSDVVHELYAPVEYVAPEVILGRKPDARSDVYSLGALLYEMLVGSPPYRHASPLRVAAGHLALHPMPMGTEVPPRVQIEVIRALAKQPEQRPASIAQLADGLARAIATPSTMPPRAKGNVHSDVTKRVTLPDLVHWPEERPTLRVGNSRIVRSRASDSLVTLWETGEGKLVVQLSADFASNPEMCKSFVDEAEKLATLDHPNVARVLNSVAEGATAYLVLETERGVTLRDLLSAGLTPSVAQRIGLEVADALQAIHERGASLGDLTPETILVTNKGRVVLLPTCVAGLSRLSDPDEPRRCYMAPELDAGDVLPGTDVYALAAILSEVMGRVPERTDTARARALSNPVESRPSAAELSSELRDSVDIAAPEEVAELVRRFCDGILDDTDLGKRKASLPPPMRLPSRTKTQQMPAPVLSPKAAPAPAEVAPARAFGEAPDTSIAPVPLDPIPKRRRRAVWVVVAMVASAALLIGFALASRPPGGAQATSSHATQAPVLAATSERIQTAPVDSQVIEEPAPALTSARAPRRAPPKRTPKPAVTPRGARGLDDLKPLPD